MSTVGVVQYYLFQLVGERERRRASWKEAFDHHIEGFHLASTAAQN